MMFAPLKALVVADDAATTVEYGLLLLLIVLVAFAGIQNFGGAVSALFVTPPGAFGPSH